MSCPNILSLPSLKIQYRLLLCVIWIVFFVFIVNFVTFWWINSLILLATASYCLTSLSCFTLSILNIRRHASEDPSKKLKGISWKLYLCIQLCLVSLGLLTFIGIETCERFVTLEFIEGDALCLIGAGTTIFVGALAVLMRSQQKTRYFTYLRNAYLHVFKCAFFGFLSLLVGAFIWYSPIFLVLDSIIGVILALFIACDIWIQIRTTQKQLKQQYSKLLTSSEIEECLIHLSGIKKVSDIYLWEQDSTTMALRMNIQIEPDRNIDIVLQEAHNALRDAFGIQYITIQVDN